MIKIFDLNNCELSYKNASYGGMAGSKEGIIFEGEEWLIKYPKNLSSMTGEVASYSTSPLSEFIGSHIYSILGYDVHDTMLGIRNGKVVVGCKDFATYNKMLLEIRTIKNFYNKELCDISDSSHISSSQTHIVDIDELLLHFQKNPVLTQIKGVKERFFEQAIIDVFIANNDRNNGNWGIIREIDKPDTLAPIYDNGASFNSKITDEKLLSIYNSPEFVNNSTNIVMAYGQNGHAFSAKKLFKFFENDPLFIQSIKKIVPLINQKFNNIKNMIYDIPEEVMSKKEEPLKIISDVRKNIYIAQMETRYEKLLLPEYELLTFKEHNPPQDFSNLEQITYKIDSFIESGGLEQLDRDENNFLSENMTL